MRFETELELRINAEVEYSVTTCAGLDPQDSEDCADKVRVFITVNGRRIDITDALCDEDMSAVTDKANEDLSGQENFPSEYDGRFAL